MSEAQSLSGRYRIEAETMGPPDEYPPWNPDE